jgi:hypothetical protein
VFSLALIGCEETMNFSNHFWQNVDGSYESKETGSYIDTDRTTKKMQWAYPLTVGNQPRGAVCYILAKGTILSVGTYKSIQSHPESLIAKIEIESFNLHYVQTPTNQEADECEQYKRENDNIWSIDGFQLSADTIYLPILAFGPGALKVGKPFFCFIGCEQIKTNSTQDFSQEAPGLYKQSEWPF